MIYAFLISLLFSCGPAARQHRKEQRLARLIKKNPQLAKTDTVKSKISVDVPEINEHFTMELTPDLWPLDSMMEHFEGKVDPVALDSLELGFKEILAHNNDMDTTIKTKSSTIRIKKVGNSVAVDVLTSPPDVKIEVPVAVTAVKPPAVLTWYERIFMKIGKTIGVVGFSLLLLFLLYIAYRVVNGFLL